jgi:uncharacterized protein YndB with AHSA1/START domain
MCVSFEFYRHQLVENWSPLQLSFEVACPVSHAFDVWTASIGRWWPPEHTFTGERALDITIESRVGGRIFERTVGGAEVDWGRVTVWEPPRRLGYRWCLRPDEADASEVEITFTPSGRSSTLVRIEHRGWHRLGAQGPAPETEELARWEPSSRTPIHERSSSCGSHWCRTESERQLLIEGPLLHHFRNSWSGGSLTRSAISGGRTS